MAFTSTPLDGSSTPIPMSSVVPDGTNTPIALEGGPSLSSGGNTLAPASMYVKDGNDVTLGLTTQTKATDGSTTSWSVVQLLKGIFNSLLNTIAVTQSGTWTVTNNPSVSTSGGSTPYHLVSAASTNATNLKSSGGQLYGYVLSNTNSSARYFRLYNLASSPTVGTSTIKHTVQVPGNATVIRVFPLGLAFGTGISFSTTAAMGDSDTSTIGAGDLSIDLDYV